MTPKVARDEGPRSPKLAGRRRADHSRPVRPLFLLGLAFVLLGCGSSSPPPSKVAPSPTPRADSRPARPANTLYRDEVNEGVKLGMGRFLALVDVQTVKRADDTGREWFEGYQIVTLRPAQAWLSFDIVPGDMITKVNGASVEHYDYLIPMFEALVTANDLRVEMVRNGQPRTLVIPIVERGGTSSSSAAKSAAPSASSGGVPKSAAPSASSGGVPKSAAPSASDKPVPAASKPKKSGSGT
jgi:hypothetical protein